MKVLITGANGFVGHAVWQLLERAKDMQVVAVVRNANALSAPISSLVEIGDLATQTDWTDCLYGVDVIIHCAARAHIMNDEAADTLVEYRKLNVAGTLTLARQAVQAGVRRLVFISSVKVNGEYTKPYRRFLADDAPAPQDAYGISKYEAEQCLMALANETGMEVVIIRPPLVYGPGVKGNFASMVRWMKKGVPLPLGAINNQRSLVSLDNLADFIALCADRKRSPKAANEVFLISDGEDVSTPELLRKVALVYGVRPRLFPVPVSWIRFAASLVGKKAVADRLFDSQVIDSSKARELLGWKPVISMDEQLQKMARHDTHI